MKKRYTLFLFEQLPHPNPPLLGGLFRQPLTVSSFPVEEGVRGWGRIILFLFFWTFPIFLYAQPPELPPDLQARLDTLALRKVHDLGQRVMAMVDKDKSMTEKNEAMKAALNFFMKDKNGEIQKIIQVSNLNTKSVKSYRIPVYLTHLRGLVPSLYSYVKIEWNKVDYISGWALQKDGTWQAMVSIEQEFVGTMGGEVRYADITQKTIQVIAKSEIVEYDGQKIEQFTIYLGNIKVQQTLPKN